MITPALRSPAALLLRFAGVLALLCAPWPGVDRATYRVASSLANEFAHATSIAAAIEPRPGAASDFDAAIALALDGALSGRTFRFPIGLRRTLFVPVAVFIATAIAARVWRCPRAAVLVLVLGEIAILALLVLASVAVPILVIANEAERIRLAGWLGDVLFAYFGMISSPSLAYALPACASFGFLYAARGSAGVLAQPAK